ncbi:MAG: DUF748 domain-containing protein [Proteobacteria bacterium]|nr:DUF748 domain-containing protein [Pseudomonadota bacterium]
MHRATKIVIWLAGFFVLFSIIGFFIVPPIVKSVLVKKLSENLHREVSLGQIRVNPYSLSVSVKNILIKDRAKAETFVSFDELFVNASISSIFRRAIIIKELKIAGPYIRIIRNKDESYNFSDLLVSKTTENDKLRKRRAGEKEKPVLFSINNIVISSGRIDFSDGPNNVQHNIKDMKVSIPFISNTEYYVNTYVQPSFSAHINGTPYTLQGKTKPFAEPREAYLDIDIKGLDLPQYITYLPVKQNFILRSGSMDIASRVSFIQSKNKAPSLMVSGDIALKNFAIDDMTKKSLVNLLSIDIAIASCEPFLKSLHLSKFIIKGPELTLKRDEKGALNLISLIEEKKDGPKDASYNKKTPVKKPTKTPVKSDEDVPFNASVDEFIIEDGKISFFDHTVSQPVELLITSLNLKGERFSTAKDSTGTLSLSLLLNKKGSISAKGPVSITPLSANLLTDVKRINIRAFQAYFTDKVKINTTSGHVNTSGTVIVAHTNKAGLNVTFKGNVLIADFASVDKQNGDDFLKWKAFSLNNINAGYNPMYAHIKGISLTDFYARVTLNPDGTLSLRKVIEEEEENKNNEQPVQAKKETSGTKTVAESEKDIARDISVGSITLQGGTIDFMDKSIKPAYSVNLTEMVGRIGGFSLQLDQRADLELLGKIDHYVPLEIAGKINPSRNNLFTDVSVKFKDLDLSAMTPYSGKYLGYKIEKGSLSIDLKYLIDKRKLDAQNRIFIDQLTLGDKVESPDALNLPLKLAIALLKDRKGRIDLDVPLSGSLDDPQFSVFRIVIKILVNLITKAVTAPFALLGALFGGGEELSYIDFDYGRAQLSQAGIKKIDTLVKALYERPSLKLDIEGHVDVEKDKEALKTYLFNKKIKTQKLNAMIKKGLPAVPVDDVIIGQSEYQQYLASAYKAEKFEKPKNVLGLAKSLPAPEMEKLMLANTVVGEGDLRTLAKQRAGQVKDALLATGNVTADRVFVVEPKSLSPEKKEKANDSRVDLKLK